MTVKSRLPLVAHPVDHTPLHAPPIILVPFEPFQNDTHLTHLTLERIQLTSKYLTHQFFALQKVSSDIPLLFCKIFAARSQRQAPPTSSPFVMQSSPTFTVPPPQAIAPSDRTASTRTTSPKPIVVHQPGQPRRAKFTQSAPTRKVAQTFPSRKPSSRFSRAQEPRKLQKNVGLTELSRHVQKELHKDDMAFGDVLESDLYHQQVVNSLDPNEKVVRARDPTSTVLIADRGIRSQALPRKVTTKSSKGLLRTSSPTAKANTQVEANVATGYVAPRNQKKEEVRKAYLAGQLEKRQRENALRNAKAASKSTKRVRLVTPSTVHMRKTVALKDSFQAYMEEISRGDLLDQGEVITLAREIQQGVHVEQAQRAMEGKLGRRPSIPEIANELGIDVMEVQKRRMTGTAAKNALVAANLRLVTSVAKKVTLPKGGGNSGLALDDMVQEGSVGLIRAAEKFDAARGYKFSTYATWWIRAYIMRSISSQSRSIKVPGTIVDEYARIRKEYAALHERGIFKPTDEQVADRVGITAAKLRFVVNVVTQVPTSLDISLSPSGDDTNSRTLGEIIEGDDNIEERMVEDMQRKELDEALQQCLQPLERAVVRLRFGLDDGQPRTLKETGLLLGLSKERIRQIIYRALPKMKTPKIQQILVEVMTH